MKVYIAGPMTGIDGFNRYEFFKAAEEIALAGHIPLNPAVLPGGLSEADYMRVCVAMLQCADRVFMLAEWQSSQGAKAEYELAVKFGLVILFQEGA
ncbi:MULTISPECIES: DUF4406 domain-containing protein [unclassified Serratia (in: enterobacteria)]|uniref:DUF4406 domain-containing protein n=1 Tax=unclassified Serratia (in: enterobacteria) TaxID=2647522 RepID=UPI00046A09C0|nr:MULTISPECIES: DUF4406 domain-containing protein [unclassified Serratia (in: enterobacteria)]